MEQLTLPLGYDGCTIVTEGLPDGTSRVAAVMHDDDYTTYEAVGESPGHCYRAVIKQMAIDLNGHRKNGVSVYTDEFRGTSYDD